MNEANGTATRCEVCGAAEPAPELLQICFDCGRPYHLNPYATRPGIDCGDAVIGETLGVHFYCHDCLAARERAALEHADGGAEYARAHAMISELHGGQLPPPPLPSARPAARRRRRYRRIDRA